MENRLMVPETQKDFKMEEKFWLLMEEAYNT
jgi:hypothetical protein